jgi:uncharacterized OB-fold protein
VSGARRVPAVEGWFTTDDEPALLGNRCTTCGTVFFPKATFFCRNPACDGEAFEEQRLSRHGRIWSFTDAQYQPPPPYVARAEPFTPFAIAAVELADEQMVVLGQVAAGYGVEDLAVGQPVELVVEELFSDDDHDYVVWKWRPTGARTSEGARA